MVTFRLCDRSSGDVRVRNRLKSATAVARTFVGSEKAWHTFWILTS